MSDYPVPPLEEKKKTNVWLIIGIVLIVLCCCLVIFGVAAWNLGDQVLQALGLY